MFYYVLKGELSPTNDAALARHGRRVVGGSGVKNFAVVAARGVQNNFLEKPHKSTSHSGSQYTRFFYVASDAEVPHWAHGGG